MDTIRKCNKCETDLTIHKGKYSIYGYCPKCFEEKYISQADGNCCFSPDINPVKIQMQGGGIQIRQQCNTCGYSFGLALKKTDYDLSKLKFRDDNKQKEFYEKIQIERAEFLKICEDFKKQNFTIEIKFPGYSEYMLSDEWQRKRELVFKRDNYICQACLTNKAVQVHHISYRHVFNEPLFELTSVCINCHDSITNMDRKNDAEKIQH
jgi:hypothetical protein